MSMEHQMKAKPKASFAAVSSGSMRRNCDKCSESNHEYQPTSRQLLNIETSAIEPPHFSHDFSQVNIGLQCKPIISQPGDALEEEADRVAEAVVGKGISEPLLTHAKGVPAIQCQGQSSPQPSQEEQYKNAAEKAGEAFLKTNLGRDIKDKALKQGKDFISTLRGKIITGAAAAGVVSTLAATNSKLPMQVPEIPLDFIAPGLKVKLNYEGPVRNPTSASLTFTYVEQVEKKERKGEPTEREKFRAETARIAEDQAKFREGLKTPEQRAAEQEQFMNAYWARKNRLGLDPTRIPGLVDERNKPALRMRDERPKREEEGLQRKATESKPLAGIPPIVHEVLRSTGQPLEPGTRAFMEERFGYDFSRVRVHMDVKAATSAAAVAADAYTIGGHIIFGSGRYQPATKGGRQLIAHELAHVLQQGEGQIPARSVTGKADSPLERQANMLGCEALASNESGATGSIAQAVIEHQDRSKNLARLASIPNYSYATPTSQGRGFQVYELVPHTIQSVSNATDGQIQRRRVPNSEGLNNALPPASDTVGVMNARTGLSRVLSRAWAGLSSANQVKVKTAAKGFGITFGNQSDLLIKLNSASRDQLVKFAEEIRTSDPTAELGDPVLIDSGPRPGTKDVTNIATVVSGANTIFTSIASGARDADISQVFGSANVGAAKIKYANACTRMNHLKVINKIVTDRSGYNDEVSLAGLTDSNQISLEPSVIDNPSDNESIITLIHESMHAGNSDINDYGYIERKEFIILTESEKLTNAAHFEVVPRRIKRAKYAFSGQTFIPAGTSVGGVTVPSMTAREQAIRGASEAYRSAWTAALRLHTLLVRLFRTPTEWNTLDLSTEFAGADAGAHFSNTLPFWSKIESLTIHIRLPYINPTGVSAVRPVTLIDIALSEGLTRKLSQGMENVPQNEADALALEMNKATASERTAAATNVDAERDLLIRLVIRLKLGSITGAVRRDERMVARLAQAGNDFTDTFRIRSPSAFP